MSFREYRQTQHFPAAAWRLLPYTVRSESPVLLSVSTRMHNTVYWTPEASRKLWEVYRICFISPTGRWLQMLLWTRTLSKIWWCSELQAANKSIPSEDHQFNVAIMSSAVAASCNRQPNFPVGRPPGNFPLSRWANPPLLHSHSRLRQRTRVACVRRWTSRMWIIENMVWLHDKTVWRGAVRDRSNALETGLLIGCNRQLFTEAT